MDLHAATAIVTGGAGLLGSATTRALVGRGAHVVVVDPDAARATSLRDELGAAAVSCTPADVCDPDAVAEAVAMATERGPLRVVINAAGAWHMQRLLGRDGSLYPLAQFKHVLEVNVVGTFLVMGLAAQAMATQESLDDDGQRGVVVNVSSLAGLEGSAGQIAYGAAKAAIAGMTLPAARDLGPVGVRVVTIAPSGMSPGGEWSEGDTIAERMLEQAPFPRRFGTPAEFAHLVMSLVDNTFLNGLTVRIDGGVRLPMK